MACYSIRKRKIMEQKRQQQQTITDYCIKVKDAPSLADDTAIATPEQAGKGDSRLLSRLLKRSNIRMSKLAKWVQTRVSWSKHSQSRGERALKILQSGDCIKRVTPHHHTVKSQSDPKKQYDVKQKGYH